MKLTNAMLSFVMADAMKNKSLITENQMMEVMGLLEDKLNKCRDEVEDAIDMAYKESYDVIKDLQQQLAQKDEQYQKLSELMNKDDKELLQDLGRAHIGFPQDDEYSIQQGDSCGCGDLKLFYQWQFVQNEKIEGETDEMTHGNESLDKSYFTKHKFLAKGSTTGTVYDGEEAAQTFVIKESGEFVFIDIGHPCNKIVCAQVDLESGKITTTWKRALTETELVVSYEFDHFKDEERRNESCS